MIFKKNKNVQLLFCTLYMVIVDWNRRPLDKSKGTNDLINDNALYHLEESCQQAHRAIISVTYDTDQLSSQISR